MATMVKEKPRSKKKTKEKQIAKPDILVEVPLLVESIITKEDEPSTSRNTHVGVVEDSSTSVSFAQAHTDSDKSEATQNETLLEAASSEIPPDLVVCQTSKIENQKVSLVENLSTSQRLFSDHVYTDVCHRLDIVTFRDIPANSDVPIEELERNLETSTAYLNQTSRCEDTSNVEKGSEYVERAESAVPSAPIFEGAVNTETPVETQEVLQDIRPKVQCMPLEVAMQVCGGKEMAEIREMSEREEAIVEAGSLPGPEHPLVDLLSTFRCSIILLEQDRHKVMQGYAAEEKNRNALWKIEKREVHEVEQCPCGKTVSYRGKYDSAELMKSKLPAAQLRLEGLLKEVQESYCHHQHSTLLAYYQIEELISETVKGSKGEIRMAAALVLHELRMSDTAPAGVCGALCGALRRWARVLCAALLDARDPTQLLFLLHHLFRQSRSVRWAAPLLRVRLGGGGDAARALALLDVLLAGARPALEAATECTEESEEMWEEVDKHGGGGAVTEGALRERDLLALLRAFPLRALVARLVLLTRADITSTRPYEWQYPWRDVVRAACGVRALLATLRRAAAAHRAYPRLRTALHALAHCALHALHALHAHNWDSYSKDVGPEIEVELEALFVLGWSVAAPDGPPPPAALLGAAPRAAYCVALMARVHDKSFLHIKDLSLELPPFPCDRNVRLVAQAAIECDDHELARIVLDFLVQMAFKRKVASCGGACDSAAKECLPRLLRAHEYLYVTALLMVAELHQVEPLQLSASTLKCFALSRWRPGTSEARAVLDDWARRCPQLLQYLLHELSYTPYDGVSLDAQLTVGTWLCAQAAPAPDWAWTTLTRLRVHRSSWGLPLDAPPPEITSGVFAEAYAVLSSSWGHSVPVICAHGVAALLRVAAARAPVAAHALPLVMAAMARSPESVSLTPQFAELASSLLAPAQSLVQWARGERGAAPALLLRRMLAQIEAQPAATRDDMVSAWMHALGDERLGGAPLSACDAVLLAARRPRILQEPPKPEFLSHVVRNAQHAPLLCEEALRAAHAHRELDTQLFAGLTHALAAQRARGQRIHVDNALKQIGSTTWSEELVVYQTAAAALAAPPPHPAHLALCSLLLRLYLHTHTHSQDTAPIGPLFFAGIIKSRTLAQLKKRLQDAILYHHNQAESFKDSLKPTPHPRAATSRETKSVSPEGDFIPIMSIIDVAGDSSGSDSENDTIDHVVEEESVSTNEEKRRVNVNMHKYHETAEKMLREFSCWLDAGDRLRAAPHHADITRFIPEPALSTAWAEYLSSMRPPPSAEDDDLRPPAPRAAPHHPPTPLQTAVSAILKIRDKSAERSQVPVITSLVEDVNFTNQRQLYSLVDKHLAYIEEFARQWSADVRRVSALDSKVWQLVAALRVRVPLSPVVRSCANRCQPIQLPLQDHYEWRISEGAASAIKDNRSSARAAIRQFCKARPQLARTVAALNTIARRAGSAQAAAGAARRAWGCAGAAPPCALAHHALTAFVEDLADRWICSDGAAVCSLVSEWCAGGASPAQQALCGALVSRAAAGAAPAQRPRLYVRVLGALGSAQPQRAFSYLSKFDMSHCVDDSQRGEMLEALSQAAQSWGREPAPELHMLVELIGVHTAALSTARHLPLVVARHARAAAAARLPPAHLAHVARAAGACAHAATFDQLGNLLRELGVIWWEARSKADASRAHFASYAPHVAALQLALQRAFVAAGCALSYAPERVSWYAWAALQESWGAWVCPRPAPPPLLPPEGGAVHYTAMLKRFVDNIYQMMLDCPGCEEQLLSQVWEWAVQTQLSVSLAPAHEHSRAQLADLLAELAALPWRECQWWRAACLPAALQISTTSDVEMQTWLADTLQGIQAATWMRDVADCDVAPRLAALLQLFAGPLPLKTETLEQAALLPWRRLPAAALDQALERFFVDHHNPLQPYHDAPQFRVILAASGLCPVEAHARDKRARTVSQWTRAASAPPLRAHVAAHARALLSLVHALEPHIEESSDELEELLGRAVVIMCSDHAAAALPAWQQWAGSASPRCAGACVRAARALTPLDYFAPLADVAVAAYMNANGCWIETARRLRGCACAGPEPLLARGRLHAAYALALLAPSPPLALLTATINFADKEVIVSVWVCAMCRAARGEGRAAPAGGGAAPAAGGEASAAGGAARAQLARWAEAPRLALLRALTGADAPTPKHRLLCRLALCIITPNSESLIRAYETACPGVLGSHPDALAWARTPSPKHMPMLAVKLFPGAENYFTEEFKMAAAL